MFLRRISRPFFQTQAFSTTKLVFGFGSHVSDNDPDILDKAKLEGKGRGLKNVPEWNEELASDSEAIVKADQEPEESTSDLQQETIEYLQKQK